MIKTYTFNDAENLWKMTVSREFLKVCKNPETKTMEELREKYKVFKHLHNTKGPALRCLIPGKDSIEMYFDRGEFIEPWTPEGGSRIKKIQGKGNAKCS